MHSLFYSIDPIYIHADGYGNNSMAPQSILTPNQKWYFGVVLVVASLILANSAFLFVATPREVNSRIQEARYQVSTYGMVGTTDVTAPPLVHPDRDLPKFYQAMLLSHIFGGLGLLGLAVVFVLWHLRNALQRKNKKAMGYGIVLVLAAVFISVSGLFILTEANTVQNRWIYQSHRILALVIPVLYLAHRSVASIPLTRHGVLRGVGVLAALWLVMIGMYWVLMPGGMQPSPISMIQSASAEEDKSASLPRDPFIPFQPRNHAKPDSVFWPSAATTATGGLIEHRVLTMDDLSNPELIKTDIEKYGFVVHDSMGSATCNRCHAGIVEQWAKSAHRFSSFNNLFYKASVENFRDEADGKKRSQCPSLSGSQSQSGRTVSIGPIDRGSQNRR